MSSPQPTFRYHPDPLASGSIVARAGQCRCCRQDRGLIYTGPVYAEEEFEDAFCPWCIADGSVHLKYRATFFDRHALDDGIPAAIAAEICERTPGYASWQGGRWPACCGDAAQFLAPVGYRELRGTHHAFESDVLRYIIDEMQISGGAARRILETLERDVSPTAYLFRCGHCRRPHVHLDYL